MVDGAVLSLLLLLLSVLVAAPLGDGRVEGEDPGSVACGPASAADEVMAEAPSASSADNEEGEGREAADEDELDPPGV